MNHKHTLVIIDPGHFHAALVLHDMHPALNQDVYVYGREGREMDSFIEIVNSLNHRQKNPTHWIFHYYIGDDFLEKAIEEHKGDIAVLTGRNDRKAQQIKRLHDADFHIFADKPLTIDERGVALLSEALNDDRPYAIADMMTERYEVTTVVQKALMHNKKIFGELQHFHGEAPIVMESVTNLYKKVDGTVVVRPAWFFDVNVQGEGIVDMTTHLVDLVEWMLFEDQTLTADDFEIINAHVWSTKVPLSLFSKITELDAFPPELKSKVKKNVLDLECNCEFTFKIKGIRVMLSVIWNLEETPGTTDKHYSLLAGTLADLVIEQGPRTGFRRELYVIPIDGDLDKMQKELTLALVKLKLPGIIAVREEDRFRIQIPQTLRDSHESHFGAVLNDFIATIDRQDMPELDKEKYNMLTKYALLAEAKKIAR